MKITKTLFLTLLSVAVLITVLNLALARWSFELGLKEFIGGIEQQRLTRLSKVLITHYQNNDMSWDNIAQHNINLSGSHRDGPRRPPPRHMRDQNRPTDSSFEPRRHRRPPPHARELGAVMELGPVTALYSADDKLLLGEQKGDGDGGIRFVIEFDQQPIGYLKSWPQLKEQSSSASHFAQQQLHTSLLIAAISIFIAGLVSWLVARRLLRPVKNILSGVSELSKGKYQVAFDHQRKDEIGQLMQDIEQLSNTLNENREAKNRWFANISHELRTPITVLQGEIEVIKAGIRPLNMEQVESFEQEVALLRRLVDDLYQLSMSDIGALRYQFAQLDLSECVLATLDGFSSIAKRKEIKLTVEVDTDVWISGDKQRIEQLILNLATNSFAYTNSPGQLQICLKANANLVTLTFIDSEPGLTQAECDMMFEPLYRHDSSRKMRESGAGLGLSICKNIVEAHQGKIYAEPSMLGGIKTTVELQLKDQE